MLQQTPVARVAPIWLDWVERWPTPSATAAASAADVLRAWGKLGYPRRAKRLHECATVIATEHGDVVPDDVETLLDPARRRRLHRPGGRVLRLPAASAGGGHQRATGGRARGARTAPMPATPSAVRDLADVAALLPERRVGASVFGGADGTRRDGVHGPVTQVRDLPAERVRVAGARATRRPTGAAAPLAALRGHRPPGARATARRAAGQHVSGRARPARRGVADRHRAAGPRAGFAAGRRAGGADGRRPLRAVWRRRAKRSGAKRSGRTGAGSPTA